MAEEFWKICKPKIQKLKGRYSANVMLIFNSWLKDIEGARDAIEFYLLHQLYVEISGTNRAP